MDQSKKQKIDPTDELKRNVLYNIIEDKEIPSLEFPPINMPKTLRSLLIVCYSSEVDSPTNSSSSRSSSNGSESNSNNSSPREWANVMAEDGNLRFDDILPLLPPAQFTEKHISIYDDTLKSAEFALSFYNRIHCEGPEYELVAPLLCNLLNHPEHYGVVHVNFVAKPKNTNLPPQLFFAEVVYENFLKEPDQEPVLRCNKIDPNPCGSSSGATAFDRLGLIHPKDMKCVECAVPCPSSSDDECYS